MTSSITQVLRPSHSFPQHRVAPAADHGGATQTMDDFAAEVHALFEAPLQPHRMLELSTMLQSEYEAKLLKSDISMLPSYQHTLPSGREEGDFLALDVGGSTFRVALVRLGHAEAEGVRVRATRSWVIGAKVRELKGRQFFDWMACRIAEMLDEHHQPNGASDAALKMGLTWSFPIAQTSPSTGRLLMMGKGFRAGDGLEGSDLDELIMTACRARGLNVQLDAIVNDGVATLLAQAYKDTATRMSLILGTGMNAAVFLPLPALGPFKLGPRPAPWHAAATRVVVNTEISMFGKHTLPATRWDDTLNKHHTLPDYQPLEYLITGRYLGEIVRLILLEALATTPLFANHLPHRLSDPYSLETRVLATFESDPTPDLTHARAALATAHPLPTPPPLADLLFIRACARLASRRAAAYLAIALHALCAVRSRAEARLLTDPSHPVTIACDGTMVEKYPGFREACQGFLDRLCVLEGGREGQVRLAMAFESSVVGAAVAGACAGV